MTTIIPTRQDRGLGKYDAPLKVQCQQGYSSFYRGRLNNPFNVNTMQFREWNRGFNKAYYENLKRVKRNEQLRKRRKKLYAGEV